MENTQSGQQQQQLNKDSLKDLWDNIKCISIENLSEEIMTENFPNLVKQIDKSRKYKDPIKINPKGPHQDIL